MRSPIFQVGMPQSHLGSNPAELFAAAAAKGASGCREDDSRDFVGSATTQTLVDRVVFRCRRGMSCTSLRRASSVTSSPATTSTSLLAKAMCFPLSMARQVGASPATPTIELTTRSVSGVGSHSQQTFIPYHDLGPVGEKQVPQSLGQIPSGFRGGHRHQLWTKPSDLIGQLGCVPAGSQGNHSKLTG